MFTRPVWAFKTRAFSILIAAGIALVAIPAPASAQGLFDFLFGGRRHLGPPPSANAYADPYPHYSGRRSGPERYASSGGSGSFCVRLCDGRYFPIQRSGAASAAQLCNSFCPASETRVFSGGAIDHAVASDGTRYASLRNAFVFRERTVQNCTCNGRDPYGLVTLDVTNDPTLRSGDIIATNEGFVAYTGGDRRHAEFTPIENYRGLSSELRGRLSQTRIMPSNATRLSPETIRERAAAVQDDRRVHVR